MLSGYKYNTASTSFFRLETPKLLQNSKLAKAVRGARAINPTSLTPGHCAKLSVLSRDSLLRCATPESVMLGHLLILNEVRPVSLVKQLSPRSVMCTQRSRCNVSKLAKWHNSLTPRSVMLRQPLTLSVAS